MIQKTEHYNLLVEDWIPVLWSDGRYSRVGIIEALTKAVEIRQIAFPNPMDRIALMRFLIALLYWCRGNPPETGLSQIKQSVSPDWFDRLEAEKHLFNLLGDGQRFYQVRDARRPRTTSDLLQEIPTGNNFWHFRHATDGVNGLCLACCTAGLLRLPMFSLSGLPNLKTGINGTPPIYVVRIGDSLLDTLFLNWTPCARLGDPTWVTGQVTPNPHEDVPLLTGLTLLSRRVWLHEPSESVTPCISCGAKTRLAFSCQFETAGRLENPLWNDPHVVYSNDTQRRSLRASDLTKAGTFRMDRPWPELFAAILETGKFLSEKDTTKLVVVGFATDQAKNIDVWERTVSFPPMSSVSAIAVSDLKQWSSACRLLEGRTGRNAEVLPWQSAIATIRPHIEETVSAKANGLLRAQGFAWADAASQYLELMPIVAGSLAPGFTTGAVKKRRQIFSTSPTVRKTLKSGPENRSKDGEETNDLNRSVYCSSCKP